LSAYAGISGDVLFSTSPSTALGSPEAATDTGNHINYFAATHQAWDETQTLTVQCSPDGSTGWATVTDYEFYWPVGEIVFNTARVVGTNNHVHISAGHYFALTSLSGAHAWKSSAKAATKDVTPFQASGNFAQYAATIKSLTFSVDCFSQDARILNEMITGDGATNISGGIVVCQLYWDKAGGKRWQFYAIPTGVDTTVASNDIDKQSIKMTADGPVYEVLSDTFSTTTVKRA
jgi:hypothetical protein